MGLVSVWGDSEHMNGKLMLQQGMTRLFCLFHGLVSISVLCSHVFADYFQNRVNHALLDQARLCTCIDFTSDVNGSIGLSLATINDAETEKYCAVHFCKRVTCRQTAPQNV